MMKRVAVVAGIVYLGLMGGCNKAATDTDDTTTGKSIVVRLMEADSTVVKDSVVVKLDSLTAVDLSGEQAVHLDQCISDKFIKPYVDRNSVSWDRRVLYGYRLIGSDGFSPHSRIDQTTQRTADDLQWSVLSHGYLKKATRDAAYDASVTLPGMYRVKDIAAIALYRKIDVVDSTATTPASRQVRLAEVPDTVYNSLPAVKLTAILSMLTTPDSLKISLRGIDSYAGRSPFTWAQIQTGYWVITSDTTDQSGFNPDLGGSSRIKFVATITAAR